MRVRFLGLLVVMTACFALPALAGNDNVIRIIREDGGVTEYNIPESAVNAPVATPAERAEKSGVPDRKQVSAPREKSAPVKDADVPAVPEVPVKAKAEVRAAPAADNEPDMAETEDKAENPPKQDHAEKEKKVEKAVVAGKKGPFVPLPGRKPPVPNRMTMEKPAPGQYISRDAALRIALDVAPPARRFNVFPGTYKERPIYKVEFITEDGSHDVMVDARSGEIVRP